MASSVTTTTTTTTATTIHAHPIALELELAEVAMHTQAPAAAIEDARTVAGEQEWVCLREREGVAFFFFTAGLGGICCEQLKAVRLVSL